MTSHFLLSFPLCLLMGSCSENWKSLSLPHCYIKSRLPVSFPIHLVKNNKCHMGQGRHAGMRCGLGKVHRCVQKTRCRLRGHGTGLEGCTVLHEWLVWQERRETGEVAQMGETYPSNFQPSLVASPLLMLPKTLLVGEWQGV